MSDAFTPFALNPTAIYTSNLGSTGNSLGKRDSNVFLGGEEVSGDGDFVPKKGRVTITGKLDYDSTTAAGPFTQHSLVPKSYVDANGGGSSVTVVNDAGAPSSSDTSVYSCLAANTEFAPTAHNHNGVYAPASHNHDGVYTPTAHDHNSLYAPLSHTHTIAEVNALQTGLDAKLGIANIKNFNSAATAYNTNGDMSSTTGLTLTSQYDILGYGSYSTTGGRLGDNSGTAIDGMVVYRANESERRTAWYLPNGRTPNTGHGHHIHTFPISNQDGLNMIGLKDATLDVTVTGLTPNQQHTITFRAASLEGANRNLPLVKGQYAPSGTGTTVTVSWVGLNQAVMHHTRHTHTHNPGEMATQLLLSILHTHTPSHRQ